MIKNSAYTKADFLQKLNAEDTNYSYLQLPFNGEALFEWRYNGDVIAIDDELGNLLKAIRNSGYIKPDQNKLIKELSSKGRFVYAMGIFEVRLKKRFFIPMNEEKKLNPANAHK
jgi:hypothetical protein